MILGQSLKSYFCDLLLNLNQKSFSPVPKEAIFYSSEVLESYALSRKFFEIKEGRVSEKVLGMKLLESGSLPFEQQKREIKDIADTALVLKGFFSGSLRNKIVDENYYVQLGKMAYARMEGISPSVFDMPHFYEMMAQCFEGVTSLIEILAADMSLDSMDLNQENEFLNAHLGIVDLKPEKPS